MKKIRYWFWILLMITAGCTDDFSNSATPDLTVQISSSTCATKVDSFDVRVEGSGVSGNLAPGDHLTFRLNVGNHRLLADSVPPNIRYDQVHYVPPNGLTITIECP